MNAKEVDKTLELFAQMMIEKIQSIKSDWTKPWFTENTLQWPCNLSGRNYNGFNALMLLMHCEKEAYKVARFCTFNALQSLNSPGKPFVSVLKGAKSFPIIFTSFTCIHQETRKKIKYEEYKELTEEEKLLYKVYPKLQVFRVFNIAQTNLSESRPELWERLTEGTKPYPRQSEDFCFDEVDEMLKNDGWICPVKIVHQDEAYYSQSRNEIVVPEKKQFKSGEAFYGTLLHEMTHSTGAKEFLDRLKPAAFGSREYAREELVAELGSALVAQKYGILTHIKEESCAYLKSWLDSLKESPDYIRTVLGDVKKAVTLITQRLETAC